MINTPAASAATPVPTQAGDTEATATPSTSSSSAQKNIGEKLNQQINQLKDRIASRVAELNLVEKRGSIGTVIESSESHVSFKDPAGKTRFVDVDEITKFSSSSAKNSFGISDLVKGTTISVLGLYNKQSQRILGRFINVVVNPTFISGSIEKIDKKNYQITVMTEDKKETLVDIQTATTLSTYTPEEGIDKYGFSKLNIGDRVMITGFPDKKDDTLLVASRILDLSVLPKNPKIIIPEITAEENEEVTPSPEGSKKTSPIPSIAKKPTPTITKKLTPTPTNSKKPTPAE